MELNRIKSNYFVGRVNALNWLAVIFLLAGALNTAQAAETLYYFHNDHLGTPQVMTGDNQAVVWQADYKPFGEVVITTAVIENNLRFPGQYFDAESGLSYNYFRYYDPHTGRYITSDPMDLVDGPNTYAYVRSNPVNRIDPPGLWSTTAHNYFIDQFFPNLSSIDRMNIKHGSGAADMPQYQTDQYAHMHAMSDGESSNSEQCRKMGSFAQGKMNDFMNGLAYSQSLNIPILQQAATGRAYHNLGMALHSAMDSTSPAHEGWQHFNQDSFFNHGDWSTSQETVDAARQPSNLARTMEAMSRAMNGGGNCSCE